MEFELNIIRAIQSIANPFLDGLFQFITMFGEEAILIPLIAVIYWSFNKMSLCVNAILSFMRC